MKSNSSSRDKIEFLSIFDTKTFRIANLFNFDINFNAFQKGI